MAQSASSALHLLDRHRPFLHLGLPAAVALLLVAAFFSGAGWLARAVVPVASYDVGVLELLQVATLGVAAWTGWQALRSARGRRRARWAFAAVTAAAVLLLLDELHYGRPLYDLLTDAAPVAPSARAGAAGAASALAWAGLVPWLLAALVALPLLAAASRAVGLRWSAAASRWAPSGWHAATLALMLGAAMLVRLLGEADGTSELALARLLAGLRELGLYYLGALLVLEAAARRGLSPQVRFRIPPALVITTGRRRAVPVPPPPVSDGPPHLVVIRGGAADAPSHTPSRTPPRTSSATPAGTPGRDMPAAGGGAARRRTAPRPAPTGAARALGAAGRLAAWTARTPRGTSSPTPSPTPGRGAATPGATRARPPADREVTPIAHRRRWLRPVLPGAANDDGAAGASEDEDAGSTPHETASTKKSTNGGPTFESPAR